VIFTALLLFGVGSFVRRLSCWPTFRRLSSDDKKRTSVGRATSKTWRKKWKSESLTVTHFVSRWFISQNASRGQEAFSLPSLHNIIILCSVCYVGVGVTPW